MHGIVGIALVLLIRYVLARSRGHSAETAFEASQRPVTGTTVAWTTGAIAWMLGVFFLAAWLLDFLESPTAAEGLALALAGLSAIAFAIAWFAPWRPLRRLARTGRPKLAYYAARAVVLFGRTGETASGAVLLGALALAHRGASTEEERAWLKRRLARDPGRGTFATAHAVLALLEARVARDEGRFADAMEATLGARALLGTVTYMSGVGVPVAVRTLVQELLALDDAARGAWGGLESQPEEIPSDIVRALRGWMRARKTDAPVDARTERAKKALGSPVLDGLFARPTKPVPPEGVAQAHREACACYVALRRGEPIGARRALVMLSTFDALLHPEFEGSLLPAELRDDEAQREAVYDELASAIAEALLPMGAPIYALTAFGPISARVYQRLEAALLNELSASLKAAVEEAKLGSRRDALGEWLWVSWVRLRYRRLELTLGPAAAAAQWGPYANAYCEVGVQLSETFPRRRALAHAVFCALQGDAIRFQDAANIEQQTHNMRVTATA